MKRLIVTVTVLAIASAVSGCGSSSGTQPLHAKVGEMYIKLDHKSVKSGKVEITVDNTGSVTHELVVIRTDTKAADLKANASGRASEKGSVGEVSDLGAGKTASKTFRLKRGHYALICNLPGHFAAGMRTDLTVD
jgi:uncharacterized cupredoxin-like copper-binding protein